MRLKLVLPLPVSINALYINQYSWNPTTRTRVPTGRRIMSKEGEQVKKEIQVAAIAQMKNQAWDYEYTKENYIYMDCYFYFNKLGRDDNNAFKLNNDALEKIVYDNDSRVLTRTQKILYDKDNPRLEVEFSYVDYRGIFDNQGHLDKFESNCKTCNRYARNCSILKKAKEGRIQEEITDVDGEFLCSKYKEIKSKI